MRSDPLSPDYGSSPQLLNLYSYVANNPLRYTDPTGLRFEDGWTPNTKLPKVAGLPKYIQYYQPPTLPPVMGPPAPSQPQSTAKADDPPLFEHNPGTSDSYVPASCALYGSSPSGDCGQWEQDVSGLDLGFGLGDIWSALTSDCAVGIMASLVVGASVFGGAWGAWALISAGGVAFTTAAAAGASSAALYYAAGPSNINNIVTYGPNAISGVASCDPR